ncbi:MAG: molybdenum cofactor biosynthesis protein B [Parvibaculum sp.]|nr:molybdenum cofactor biosynthesis protein B [Parvibaculum sp.]
MPGIDTSRKFIPLNIAVLTVSDSRTPETDKSGDVLAERIETAGHNLAARRIVSDDVVHIRGALKAWISDAAIDVVISTGGTGLTGRDVTPEAFKTVYDKEIEGFAALFHRISYEKIGTSTIQSRATAGVAGGTFLFALPGSPGACKDGWDEILVYQFDNRHGPCNFIDIMPRLEEHKQR